MKLKLILSLGLACTSTVSALAASAKSFDDRWYLSPMASFAYADEDRFPNSGERLGFHVGVGKAISEAFNVELRLQRGEFQVTSADSLDQYGFGVEAQYFFNRNRGFAPYLELGASWWHTEYRNVDIDNPMVDAGVGFLSTITHGGIAVRGDIRYRLDFFDFTDEFRIASGAPGTGSGTTEYGDVTVNLGLLIPFGRIDSEYTRPDNNFYDDRWYITPQASFIFPDKARPLGGNGFADNGYGYGLGVGRAVSDNWNLELVAYLQEIDLEASGGRGEEINQQGIGIDALRFFTRNSSFAPYGVFGIHALRSELGGVNRTNPAFNIGAGFQSEITDHGTAIRADARLRLDPYDFDDNNGHTEFADLIVTVALAIPFGEKPVPTPADSDGDGVADTADNCPNTPAGAVVDVNGCEVSADSDNDGVRDADDQCPNTPAGIAVDASGCPIVKDSDLDGVPDDRDQCPNTPPGVRINPQGCAISVDTDGDGVADIADQCPNTPANTTVNAQGCPILSDRVVYFNFDSAVLTNAGKAELNGVIDAMLQNQNLAAIATGHADEIGSEQYNLGLSSRRANAVKDYLVKGGARVAKIVTKAEGETKPAASNATEAGRAQNRRVEVKFLDQ